MLHACFAKCIQSTSDVTVTGDSSTSAIRGFVRKKICKTILFLAWIASPSHRFVARP